MSRIFWIVLAIVVFTAVILIQISGGPYHHKARAISVAEISALGVALDGFKADHGYYPSNVVSNYADPKNNAALVTALMPTNGGRVYFYFNPKHILNGSFVDPYGYPYGYDYSNGSSLHNGSNAYDLWSTRGGSTNPTKWISNW